MAQPGRVSSFGAREAQVQSCHSDQKSSSFPNDRSDRCCACREVVYLVNNAPVDIGVLRRGTCLRAMWQIQVVGEGGRGMQAEKLADIGSQYSPATTFVIVPSKFRFSLPPNIEDHGSCCAPSAFRQSADAKFHV